ARAQNTGDDGGRIQAFGVARNHALGGKDKKALEMLFANTMVSVDIYGSGMTESEFLVSVKAPEYQALPAVPEKSNVQIYMEEEVVVVFRVKGIEKGRPYVHRERFVDTWIKISGTWQCVATTAALIPAKAATD